MSIKEFLKHREIENGLLMSHDVPENSLDDIDLVVHEVEIQKSALWEIGKAVKFCKVPVFGQREQLFDVTAVQVGIIYTCKDFRIGGELFQIVGSTADILKSCHLVKLFL